MKIRIVGAFFALVLAFVSAGSQGASAATIRTGRTARTTVALNFRTGPDTSYSIIRTLRYNTTVYVQSGAYNGRWYKVRHNGRSGFVHGDYLTQGGSGGGSVGTSGNGGYSRNGQAIANTAKSYAGYRYNYNGNSPSEGFSCTGFTQWVFGRHGVSLPLSLSGQAGRGYSVSRGNLRAGDLVLFQNTWWNGLSHAGVYVGNGWMVDASNPSTGVVWSNIYGSYYNGRWWGGRRLVN